MKGGEEIAADGDVVGGGGSAEVDDFGGARQGEFMVAQVLRTVLDAARECGCIMLAAGRAVLRTVLDAARECKCFVVG